MSHCSILSLLLESGYRYTPSPRYADVILGFWEQETGGTAELLERTVGDPSDLADLVLVEA